jgi:hypothetical protein
MTDPVIDFPRITQAFIWDGVKYDGSIGEVFLVLEIGQISVRGNRPCLLYVCNCPPRFRFVELLQILFLRIDFCKHIW